jgi:hypothetical protein
MLEFANAAHDPQDQEKVARMMTVLVVTTMMMMTIPLQFLSLSL